MRKNVFSLTLLVVLLSLTLSAFAQAAPVTLKFACWDYEVTGYDMALIEAFQKANPDIKVEVYDIPNAEYNDKLLIMLAGGEDIDVFYAKDPNQYGGYVLRNQILQVDDLIARDNLELSGYGNKLDFITIDGNLYGLPYRSDFWLLYYNKGIFDKAGLPYPTNDMTWPEYRDLAKTLTSGSGANKTYGTFIHTWASTYFIYGVQKGIGDLVTGDYDMLRDGLELAYQIQMVDKSAADFATNKSMSAHYKGVFEQGNIAMMYMGSWFMQALLSEKAQGIHDVDWGIAQLPHWEEYPKATIGSATPVVINSKTEKLEAAWKLAKFLGGPEGAAILADHVITPGYIDAVIFERFASVEGFPTDNLEALSAETIYPEWPPHQLSGLLGQVVEEEIVLAMTGNKSIDKAIADMETRRKEVVRMNQ